MGSLGFFLAYIDPGTGSVIWQVMLAGIVIVGFSFRTVWRRVRSLFGARAKREDASGPPDGVPGEGRDEPK